MARNWASKPEELQFGKSNLVIAEIFEVLSTYRLHNIPLRHQGVLRRNQRPVLLLAPILALLKPT